MQINVSKLLKEPVGSERNYQVSGTINIMDNGKSSKVACARCLKMFGCPLVLDFEEEYFPTSDIASGDVLTPPDEPCCFTIDEYQVIDLTEAVRQYALMALPMKPLCRQDCAGL
jgi:uncharacterized protein